MHIYASRARRFGISKPRIRGLFIGADYSAGIVDYAAQTPLVETAFKHLRVCALRAVTGDKEKGVFYQQEVAFDRAEAMVGRILEVIIEGKVSGEGVYVGRTYMDSPNVDGLIFVNGEMELMSGDFVRVRVTKAAEYDLIGEVCDESAQ